MPVLNQVTVGDTYGSGGAQILNVWNSRGGWFSITNATAFVQLQYGPLGASHLVDEIELGIGAFVILPPTCIGIQFRNAVAGQVATVTAQIAQGDEPALAVSAIGTVTALASSPTTRQVFTTVGVGTYTLPVNCRAILIECIGGGGGGGGAATSAGAAGCGGGGGGGGYAAKTISNPAATFTLTVGAGGTGGVAGNNVGQPGVASTFGAGPLVSGPGGSGGNGAAATTAGLAAGGAGGSGAIGDVGSEGGSGGAGKVTLATETFGGAGGNAAGPYGGGVGTEQAIAGTTSVTGNNGHQFGGGGTGGAQTNGSAAAAGGNGSKGIIVVTEFY